ncbi:MAG TPA: ribonuclease HII [Thermoanaerobaculia bacterium]|nr:ribonuclease HII [Thermoanaerobaculia bacterium]
MVQRRPSACDLSGERVRVRRLFDIEVAARAEGFRVVAGVDEVGRGCLAGPVYAGAVVFGGGTEMAGLDDSKVLDPQVRTDLAGRIRRRALGVGVGAATAAEIDALGIAPATLLAMRRALGSLSESGTAPDLVLFDAVTLPGLDVPQRAFVRGDARVACIAAASVVAKDARDRAMDELDRALPYYGFGSHRGYGTPEHLGALRRHGPSPEHRLTFDRVLPAHGRRAA